MSDKTQKLVLSILDFLRDGMNDGTVKEDDKESLEVAIQCIGEAFGVDETNDQQRAQLSIKPATLKSIFDVYLKTQASRASTSAQPKATSTPTPAGPSTTDKAEAEKLKQLGNQYMTSKKFTDAIDAYTKAIAFDPKNPVYYSNRAAAHSSNSDHAAAVTDAEKAIEVDPAFVKSYHRLGHAHYALGEYSDAAAAFKRGLDLEPSNANLRTGYEAAKQRAPPETDEDEDVPAMRSAPGAGAGVPDLASMANMFGGGGAGGGMPDLASMLSNPAIASMAQNLMANGGLDQLMSNPALANMASRLQQGGGMPSMSEIMGDPNLRDLAQQFMGGAGAGAGRNPPPGSA